MDIYVRRNSMPYVMTTREGGHFQEEDGASVGRRARTPFGSESCSMIAAVWTTRPALPAGDTLLGQSYTTAFSLNPNGGVFYAYVKDGANASRTCLLGLNTQGGRYMPTIMGFTFSGGRIAGVSTVNASLGGVDETTGIVGYTPYTAAPQWGVLGNGVNTTRTALGVGLIAAWVSSTYGFATNQELVDEILRWKDLLQSGRDLEPLRSTPDEDYFWHAEDANQWAWTDRISKLYTRRESADRLLTMGSIPAVF